MLSHPYRLHSEEILETDPSQNSVPAFEADPLAICNLHDLFCWDLLVFRFIKNGIRAPTPPESLGVLYQFIILIADGFCCSLVQLHL